MGMLSISCCWQKDDLEPEVPELIAKPTKHLNCFTSETYEGLIILPTPEAGPVLHTSQVKMRGRKGGEERDWSPKGGFCGHGDFLNILSDEFLKEKRQSLATLLAQDLKYANTLINFC